MKIKAKLIITTILIVIVVVVVGCTKKPVSVHDPGVRSGSIDAGASVSGLSANQLAFITDAQARFVHPEAVVNGLGPTFNADSCGTCHSQPAIGGSSPSTTIFPKVGPNPQVALANANGATNKVPFFITSDGPVREARFKSDGGVHDLFTITGRSDAPGCIMAQPDFDAASAANNLIFRIPTPLFGDGLIESISDEAIIANQGADAATKKALGIHGVPNRTGNDGSITRFGWKAQNPSLLIFASEAYNVEIGETNQGFSHKRGSPPQSCLFNPQPEDQTNIAPDPSDPVAVPSDDDQFALFMRFLDQPTPRPTTQSEAGKKLFISIGCSMCHTPTLVTSDSSFVPSLSTTDANLFSDILLHHMGNGLADGITQGNAGPDQFRTAPLWGVGQRIFFLHDGRTTDLYVAIQQHSSHGSEANKVIYNYNKLSPADQQLVLEFLRSL
jgi:CxxC motif-containing protein (DUF1111 family)